MESKVRMMSVKTKPTHHRLLPRKHSSPAAFTLFEILLVLAIIAIISASALPLLSNSSQLENEIENSLRSIARRTRASAISSGEPRQILIHENGLTTNTEKASLPEGLKLHVRRFGEQKFRKPRNNEPWLFSPDGILEPLSLRVIGGPSDITLDFCPLTALEPPR